MAQRASQLLNVFWFVVASAVMTSPGLAQELVGPPEGVIGQSAADHFLARMASIGELANDGGALPDSVGRPSGVAGPELKSALEEARDQDTFEVDITALVPQERRHVQETTHTTAMQITDGRLNGQWIDGKPATLEDVEALKLDLANRLSKDAQEHSAAIHSAWRALEKAIPDLALRARAESGDEDTGVRSRKVELTAEEVRHLESIAGQVGLRVDVSRSPAADTTISQAAATIGISANTPYTGSGVGVWQSEPGHPIPAFLPQPVQIIIPGETTEAEVNHATIMAGIFQQVASGASMRYTYPGTTCVDFTYSAHPLYIPPTYVGTHSFSVPSLTGDYDDCDAEYDNEILDRRIWVFKSAGNWRQLVQSFEINGGSKARNIVTVGNANTSGMNITCQNGYTSNSGQVYCTSRYVDPDNGSVKPEMVAPGTNIEQSFVTEGAGSGPGSGTSQATALSAALGAIMVEAYPMLQLRPHLAKALLLATTEDFDDLGAGLNTARDGYGMPTWARISDLDAATSSVEGPNIASGISMNVTLEAGTTYRIVLAWLNEGTHAVNNGGQVTSRWKLAVDAPGSIPTISSNLAGSGQQVMTYNALVSGVHTISGTRVNNYNVNIPTAVALAVVKR